MEWKDDVNGGEGLGEVFLLVGGILVSQRCGCAISQVSRFRVSKSSRHFKGTAFFFFLFSFFLLRGKYHMIDSYPINQSLISFMVPRNCCIMSPSHIRHHLRLVGVTRRPRSRLYRSSYHTIHPHQTGPCWVPNCENQIAHNTVSSNRAQSMQHDRLHSAF